MPIRIHLVNFNFFFIICRRKNCWRENKTSTTALVSTNRVKLAQTRTLLPHFFAVISVCWIQIYFVPHISCQNQCAPNKYFVSEFCRRPYQKILPEIGTQVFKISACLDDGNWVNLPFARRSPSQWRSTKVNLI